MNNARELAQLNRLRATRDAMMVNARDWRKNDRRYTGDKLCRKYERDAVRTARRTNSKIVALRRLGSARPVTVVMQALLPLIEGVRARAIEYANERVGEVRQALVKAGGNVDAFAPDPPYDTTRDSVKELRRRIAREYRHFVFGLTQPVTSTSKATIRRLDAEGIDRYARDCIETSEHQFLAYVFKMDAKVGAVATARLVGEHVWSRSHLIVAYADGSEVIWRTQQIENRSPLGRYFPQWPSRVVTKVE